MKNTLIRCDSSSSIGIGHVKRCLLLAKRLKLADKSLNISFATQNLKGNINLEIIDHGFVIYSLKSNKMQELNSLIAKLNSQFLIIDSYDIDCVFEKELKTQHPRLKILSFDDMVKPHYADIVLNHGIQAKKQEYTSVLHKSTKILCGSKYTLLRDEFFKKYKERTVKNSVAIILGGNDVLNLSSKITELLLMINPKYKITIITTSANLNIKELKQNSNIEVLVDITNIAKVLASKNIVICSTSGTLFEVMALGKKFINIEVATNQKALSSFLKKNKIKTTIEANKLTLKKLKNKIAYINKNKIYKRLSLKFSKTKLPQAIIKELTC